MSNRGFTLIEVLLGFALFLGVMASVVPAAHYVYRFWGSQSVYYSRLIQLNSIQQIIARDVERSENLSVTVDRIKGIVGGSAYEYYLQDGIIIRQMGQKVKLNSEGFVSAFKIARVSSVVLINYTVELEKGRKVLVKDAVYAGNL